MVRQRLQLGFQGVIRNPLAEFAALVKDQLGLDVEYTPAELHHMDIDLDKRLSAKELRSSRENIEKVKAARARRIGYKRQERAGSVYLSGGGAEALDASVRAAQASDWLRDEEEEAEPEEEGSDTGEVGEEGEDTGQADDLDLHFFSGLLF